jgi:hypothetical protein
MQNKIIVIMVCAIIISSNIQPIFAEIFFPSTNFRLYNIPTYCVVIPNDAISEQQKNQWASLGESAVLAWEEKLKNAEEINDNLWDINVKIVTEDESENCGINIIFKDKPSLTGTIAGFFTWPPGSVTIYYLQLELCGLFTCYDDETFVSDDVIYAVALHEIGHSFGLDHYVSDDVDTNSKWQTSSSTPPSIMIPTIHNNPSLQEITNVDTSKVREIYGSEGFYAFSSIPIPEPTPEIPEPTPEIPEPTPEIPEPTPEIIQPIIPEKPFSSIRVSEKIIAVQDHQQQIIKISGSVSDDNLLRGHPVIVTIHKPDQSIQVLKTGTASSGYFETLLIFDKNALRGNYHISASYIERVDKSMDVSFEIVDKITTPSILADEQDSELPSIPNQNEPNQIETESDEIIPNWIKNNARWWSEGNIDDETFVDGIEFLVSKNIIDVPKHNSAQSIMVIPDWIKNNARWWSEGNIDDETFVDGIEFLVKIGIVKIG